jgi:hypothetical protein
MTRLNIASDTMSLKIQLASRDGGVMVNTHLASSESFHLLSSYSCRILRDI